LIGTLCFFTLLQSILVPFVVIGQRAYRPDFVIPSTENPRYFVEVRSSLAIQTGYDLAHLAAQLKTRYPSGSIVLLARTRSKEMTNFLLNRAWDAVFDVSELNKFVSMVKNESPRNH